MKLSITSFLLPLAGAQVAENCRGGVQKSVLFILDGSGSVTQENFDASLSFIRVIGDYLDISSSGQEVALEQFGSTNQMNWEGRKFYTDRNDFYGLLQSVSYISGGTATCPALDYANYNVLPYKNYQDHAIVVITDGESNEGQAPYICADKLRNERQSSIYAIGVGDFTQKDEARAELESIANSPKSEYVNMGKWDQITDPVNPVRYNVSEDLANRICGAKYCTCSNGDPAVGEDCPQNGQEYCAKCDWHFDLNTDFHTCQPEQVHHEIKEEQFESSISMSGVWTDNYLNINSKECQDIQKDLIAVFDLVLGRNFKSLVLKSVQRGTVKRTVRSVDSELIISNYDITLEGYDTDNLAEIFNEETENHELDFAFMGFDAPQPIATPCESAVCDEFSYCINSADNLNFTCEFYECSCQNGTVKNNSCSYDGENVCESCIELYHLEGDTCPENQCNCDHGTVSDTCEVHAASSCASCDSLFHLDSQQCLENVCQCDNGATVEACEINGQHICTSCDRFYHLEGDLCSKNECSCENGQVTDACEVHETDSCSSCDFFFHLENEQCLENQCSCENGQVTDTCEVHESNICKSCIEGFHLESETCLENICICNNGTAPLRCEIHESQICETCDESFTLTEDGLCAGANAVKLLSIAITLFVSILI